MGYAFEVEDETHTVCIRLRGEVDTADILEAVREMEARGVRRYGELWDLVAVRSLAIGPEGVAALVASAVQRKAQYGDDVGRLAVVAHDRVYYSISRLIQHHSVQSGVAFAVFTDHDDARAWLAAAS